ncbi:hypothetical protein D3C87_1458650 [compost metagenome]
MSKRAWPGTEIIQRNPDAQSAQQTQLLAGLFRVVHQGVFRHLDFQMTRLQTMTLQHLTQLGDQIRHGELTAAQTDAQHQVLGKQRFPGFALPCTALVDPAAQATDQPRFFQQR